MSSRYQTWSILIPLFLLGWVTYAFALYNVAERYSITLLLVVSLLLTVVGLGSKRLLTVPVACLLSSGLLAWLVAIFSYSYPEKTLTHLVQYLLAVGAMAGAHSIDWEIAFPRFRRAILWIAGITLAYGAYQFVARKHGLPFAFLPMTNLQLGSDEGLQRGAMNLMRGASYFTRVSSFFPEPSDLGRFMLWVFAVGYASAKGRLRLALICTGLAGVIISQSMGGLVGVPFLVVVATLLKRDFRRVLLFFVMGAVIAAAMYKFVPQAFHALGTRAGLIVTEREQYLLQSGRFADVEDNIRVFRDSPFVGYGLASLKHEVPDNVVASAWELLLIERGLLGTILFMAPFFWAFGRLGLSGGKSNEMRNVALMLLIVEIYMFATFSTVFFPATYVALGFALYACACVPTPGKKPSIS